MHPAGPRISIPTKLLATGVACALAVVVCGTAATVMVASDVTTALGTPSRAQLLRAANRPGPSPASSFRDIGATALALDSLVAPLGPPVHVEPNVLASLLAVKTDGAKREVPSSTAGAVPPAAVPDVFQRRMALPFRLDTLSRADVAGWRQDVQDPYLPLFRQWARGSKQPSLWRYPAGVPDVDDTLEVPTHAFRSWRLWFAENELASLLALRDGQPTMAMERARENVAGARQFAEQPVVLDALYGHMFLRRSLQTLAFVAQSTGDLLTAIRANQLVVDGKYAAITFSVRSLAEPESHAGSQAAEEFAANKSMHPAVRVEALSMITRSGCRSLPELVFGFSEKRRDAMTRAVANIQDIDRAGELGARQQKFLEYALALHEAPEKDSRRSILSRSVLLNTFSWIVPPGVRARAAMCMEQGL